MKNTDIEIKPGMRVAVSRFRLGTILTVLTFWNVKRKCFHLEGAKIKFDDGEVKFVDYRDFKIDFSQKTAI